MAKRKITVTVDEELVEAARGAFNAESLSAIVNTALAHEIDRRARRAALGRLLAEWEDQLGPVDPSVLADAESAFDEFADLSASIA